ncbi:sialidase family protein [Paenibacillus ginsengarvi]|uniref:Neuraminidase (Sialidase) n=1 Tax=Paenibacillus ginsengarvi TaxID=400777 RepID=A0A3B0C2A9_9BACL|nr:sialidase family protein [Paenibacillus ginsengarvi]RKN80455.1 neuraminidase (sialidase) [Paenibacillus ginsengarvi]
MKVTAKEKQYIFEDRRPFASCHASSLVVLEKEDLLAVWFGGTKEGANDVAIWSSRRTRGEWSEPRKVAYKEGLPHWNPVLFRTKDGHLQLYYKVGHTIPHWSTMVATSLDGGASWSTPHPLVEGDVGGRGPVRSKPIYVSSGKLLAPASVETLQQWDAFVDISDDDGITWTRSANVPVDHRGFPGKGIIQPTLWESPEGVHMLLRSTAGAIYRSDSRDQGVTWSAAYRTTLPNNNSGIDLAQTESGVLALVYNPVGTDKGPRTPLVVRLSASNGETWDHELVLESEPGEYSYPAIIAEQNRLYITYTWNRVRIVCWSLTLET